MKGPLNSGQGQNAGFL